MGDIVLRKDETAAGQTYKYARVIKVHVGTDGKVRAADIDYKIPGEARFRTITQPIHNMVLVIPVEEQMIKSGEERTEAAEPETRSPDKRGGIEVQETGVDKTPQAGGMTEADPPGAKEVKGKPNQ